MKKRLFAPLLVLCVSCQALKDPTVPELLRIKDRVDSTESVSPVTEGKFAGANKRSPHVFDDSVAFVTDANGGRNLDIWYTALSGQGPAKMLVTTGQSEKAPVVGLVRGRKSCVFIADGSSKQEVKSVVYPDGYSQQLVVAPTNDSNWPDLAMDGSAMLYSEIGGDGQYDIHHLDFQSAVRTTLTDGQRARFNPADPHEFTFTKKDDNDVWNLFTSRLDEQPRQITFNEEDTFDPSYSPSGRWIAFVSNVNDSSDIWVMDAKNPRRSGQLVTHGAADCEPTWTPDGKSIVFASDRNDGVFELYRVGFDADALGLSSEGETPLEESDRGTP